MRGDYNLRLLHLLFCTFGDSGKWLTLDTAMDRDGAWNTLTPPIYGNGIFFLMSTAIETMLQTSILCDLSSGSITDCISV